MVMGHVPFYVAIFEGFEEWWEIMDYLIAVGAWSHCNKRVIELGSDFILGKDKALKLNKEYVELEVTGWKAGEMW